MKGPETGHQDHGTRFDSALVFVELLERPGPRRRRRVGGVGGRRQFRPLRVEDALQLDVLQQPKPTLSSSFENKKQHLPTIQSAVTNCDIQRNVKEAEKDWVSRRFVSSLGSLE